MAVEVHQHGYEHLRDEFHKPLIAELMGKLSGEMDLDILGIIRDDRSDSVTDESE